MRFRPGTALLTAGLLGAAVMTAGPAEAVPPATVTFTVQGISPNGDGHHDKGYLHFDLSAAATGVSWHIAKSPSRLAVTDEVALGSLAAGDHEVVWDGKDADAKRVPNGLYALYLTADLGGGAKTYESGRFRVNVTSPHVTMGAPPSASLYPQVDGYRDTLTVTGGSDKPALPMVLTLTNAAGHTVRTWKSPKGDKVVWNGKTSSGHFVAAGRYSLRWTSTDELGNTGQSSTKVVNVSAKKLESRMTSVTVTPKASRQSANASKCSSVTFPAPGRGWTGSVALRSGFCAGDNHKTADAIANLFAGVKRPSGAGTWSATLEIYGVATNSAGTVQVGPVTSPGQLKDLGRGLGWHKALHQTYTATQGDEDIWGVVVQDGAGYDVRSFRVTFHYHVLV